MLLTSSIQDPVVLPGEPGGGSNADGHHGSGWPPGGNALAGRHSLHRHWWHQGRPQPPCWRCVVCARDIVYVFIEAEHYISMHREYSYDGLLLWSANEAGVPWEVKNNKLEKILTILV
ncbi:hypothetical protein VPH35_073098 [Triticum aestivum]